MKVFMIQFIKTFTGVRMNSACELVQTLFSATWNKAVWPGRLISKYCPRSRAICIRYISQQNPLICLSKGFIFSQCKYVLVTHFFQISVASSTLDFLHHIRAHSYVHTYLRPKIYTSLKSAISC